jgi:hypothetical protein
LDSDSRLSLRQEKSVPVLRAIKEWLDAKRASVLPKSSLGAAITYATNQWQALRIRPAKDRGCVVSYDGAFPLECSSWLDLTCVIPNSNVSGARL